MLSQDQRDDEPLNEFLISNYGTAINFWFGFTNETHYNCETWTRNRYVNQNAKLGFICQYTRPEKRGLTGRHIILLTFVAVAAFLAVTVFIIIKCFCLKKRTTLEVSQDDLRKDGVVTDIK